MDYFSPEITHKLESAVERMPAFPRSVQKILEISNNLNCTPKEIMEVIETDPVMTIKVLRVINSAYFSLPYKINSVDRAVIYIGINTVKNLALSLAAIGILPARNDAGFDMDRYLHHSLVTAGIARQLAMRFAAEKIDPMDCYIAGLLHDFGKVVFAQFMPEEFRKALQLSADSEIPLHVAESTVLGTNHAVAGSLLAKRWNFPDALVAAVRYHHTTPVRDNVLDECLRMADMLAKNIYNQNQPAGRARISDWQAKHLGLSVEQATASLGDMRHYWEEANIFLQASVG